MVELAAGVEQVGPAGRVGVLGHQPVARQDELAQVGRADQRAGAEAHVVAAPDDLHPLELQDALHGHAVHLQQAPGDGRHQVALVKKRVAQRLVAHQPGQVLGEVGETLAADDAHALGQVLAQPLQRRASRRAAGSGQG